MSSAVAVEPPILPAPARPAAAEPRGRGSPLPVLMGTVFVDIVGFGIVIPLLPLYAQRFGAGPIAVAWLLAVYSLMQFLFAPVWGRWSDRRGRRPVLLLGLFGSALSYLLCGAAGSVAALMVARALAGLTGATVGVAQAYVADVTPARERARGMGLIGAAFGIGFVVGPALGGALAGYGPAVPMFAAGGLALANALVALRTLPESLPPERRSRGATLSVPARLRTLLAPGLPGGVRALFAASFLVTVAFAATEATLSLWAHHRLGFTPRAVALLFAYLGIVSALAQGGLTGWATRRWGERPIALVGIVLLAAGLGALPLAGSTAGLGAALALLAAGQGTAGPSLTALISRAAGADAQGHLLGVAQSLGALARVAGPLAGGAAFAFLSADAPYLGGALVAAGALGVLALAGEAA